MKYQLLVLFILFSGICLAQHCDLDNKSVFIVNVRDMATDEPIKGLKLTVVDSSLVELKSQHYGSRKQNPLIFEQYPSRISLKYPLQNHFLLTNGSYFFYVLPGDYPYQERSIDFIKIEDSLERYPTKIIPFDTKNKIPLCPDSKTDDIKKRVVEVKVSKKEKIVDSTFRIDGIEFQLNGINCKWRYELKYIKDTNNNSRELFVSLISQNLINTYTKKSILELDLSQYEYIHPKNISELEYNKYFDYINDKLKDINFDGYDDFEFHDNVGGANQNYTVYLFNPNLKKFQYSDKLSGVSLGDGIELDKKKKMAIYSGKGGGGLYGFRKVHFNLDGTIKYEERFWNEDLDYYSFKDSINHYKYAFYYLRQKNNMTIDSLRVEKEVKDMEDEPIYGSFFEWIKTFDK